MISKYEWSWFRFVGSAGVATVFCALIGYEGWLSFIGATMGSLFAEACRWFWARKQGKRGRTEDENEHL